MNAPTSRVARYDLHCHTYWSYDALANPQAYFPHAREIGVKCLAITEHHNIDSLPQLLKLAAEYPDIRLIPSAELTVTTSLGSVDLLCYGLPVEPHGLDAAALAGWQRVRQEYYQWQREYGAAVCRGLQALGLDYTDAHRIELLKSYRPAETIQAQGFTHVRNGTQREYFIQRGFIKDEQGYWELLHRAASVVATPPYPAVERVVPAVKAVGGLIAIAHPYIEYFQGTDRRRMDQLREECQLDGIECAHLTTPPEAGKVYRQYCLEHGLFSTGGTDPHTDTEIVQRLGRHGGDDEWLDEFLERLDARGK